MERVGRRRPVEQDCAEKGERAVNDAIGRALFSWPERGRARRQRPKHRNKQWALIKAEG